jgi:hypothetical protein
VALLSGARNHGQVVLSQQIYDRMQCLFPGRRDGLVAASVLVSNIYSSSGDQQRAREVRLARIKQFGRNVLVGVSWTRVNGELAVSVKLLSFDELPLFSFSRSGSRRTIDLIVDRPTSAPKSSKSQR